MLLSPDNTEYTLGLAGVKPTGICWSQFPKLLRAKKLSLRFYPQSLELGFLCSRAKRSGPSPWKSSSTFEVFLPASDKSFSGDYLSSVISSIPSSGRASSSDMLNSNFHGPLIPVPQRLGYAYPCNRSIHDIFVSSLDAQSGTF